MKKQIKKPSYHSMAKEYHFENGVRGKYSQFFKAGKTIILEPDVAKKFKSSEAVNNILRLFIQASNQLIQKPKQAQR